MLIRLGAIGDVVNALVLACALKREWPEVRIGWAIHPRARGVLDGHPAIDEIHEIDPRGRGSLVESIATIRARGYELTIDLQRLFKSGLLAFLSGAPRRLGFDRNRSRELSWLFSNEKLAPHDPQRHVVDQYLEFARNLGVARPQVEWRLAPAEGERETAARRLAGAERWAVLHLGAGKPANRWHAAGWARLAATLAGDDGLSVALVGGGAEQPEAAAVRALLPVGRDVLDLTGKTTLGELMAVLERAAIVVSADSGPMHLAVALGRPVVALFGPANHLRTGPYGQLRHVIARQDLWCSPCFRKKPCSQYVCMPGISAARVAEQVRAVLSSRQPWIP